jgi:uncharacterized protein YndB with AHSA1/START domain
LASVIVRASPEKVFDAWLDPAVASRFLAAGAMQVSRFENDPCEGGAFRLDMQDDSDPYVHHGRYVLIERPHRLVFTWVSAGTDGMLSLVTVTFTPVEGGVRVDLEHEGIPDAEKARRHDGGWDSILAKLADLPLG